MIPRTFSFFLKWLAALVLLGNLLALAYLVRTVVTRTDPSAGADQGANTKAAKNPGEILLQRRVADSLLLEVETPQPEDRWVEPLTVYGQVVPNPLATVEVRSPFAGTLREGSNAWPQPGQWLKAGDVLGVVDFRVAPQDRLELQNKVNKATQEHKVAIETFKVKQANLASLEGATKGSITPRELAEARLQLKDAESQEVQARSALDLWKEALAEVDRPGPRRSTTWSQILRVPAAGEVTDLAGRAGTAVEAGALVLRLVDFRRPLVRLDLPPEVVLKGPPRTVDLAALTPAPGALNGARNQPQAPRPAATVHAHRVATAAGVNAASQFAGYLYEVDAPPPKENGDTLSVHPEGVTTDGLAWRPGLLVKALLPGLPGPNTKPQLAVSVPAAALLYHQGRALIYKRKPRDDDNKKVCFARIEVQVLGRQNGRWVLATSDTFDDKVEVVVRNAQVLLSEEFKAGGDDDD